MDAAQFDVAIRVGAIGVILLLAWLLFRQRRDIGMPAWLFLPMSVCLSCFLIGNTPDPALRLAGIPAAIAGLASGSTVVFLWWFCLACFDRHFRPRGAVLTVGLLWIALAAADRAAPSSTLALSYMLVAIGFGIVAHLVWRLVADRHGDFIEKRHDARAVVALLLGGQLLIDLSVDLVLGFSWRPRPFAIAQNAALLAFALWLAGRVLDARPGVLDFAAVPRMTPLPQPVDVGELLEAETLRRRLAELIEVERIHLDPELSFATFVQRMNAPERSVRKLINHALGFDHFRSFLNHYRMIEARRLLSDRQRASDKLIAIALDSGFASVPSFNRVFRATESCTPSQYRESALAAPAAAADAEKMARSALAPPSEKRTAAF
jgi:AraC-like DNA-binding protein